jgi:predicted dehydrogenase
MVGDVINVGLVGCGAVVKTFYVEVMRRIAGVKVIGVHDLNTANAREVATALGVQAMEREALLGVCDWVVIATPPDSHYGLAREALERGCHVVLEKPFVPRASEAQDLVELAEGRGRQLHVAQFRRFFPPVGVARDLVASGLIGEVVRLEMYEGARFLWSNDSGYVSKSRFGGVLFDTGSHTVDQGLVVAGLDEGELGVEVEKVERDKPEPSHQIEAMLRLRRGGRVLAARLLLSRAQPLANLIRVIGTQGMVEMDCGFDGLIRWSRGGSISVFRPARLFAGYGQAFLEEYRAVFRLGSASPTHARRMVNQVKILEMVDRAGSGDVELNASGLS